MTAATLPWKGSTFISSSISCFLWSGRWDIHQNCPAGHRGCLLGCFPERSCLTGGRSAAKAGPWFCAGASGWSYCIQNYLEISLLCCHNQCRICLCKIKLWCCATHQNKDTIKSEREVHCPLMLLGWFTLSVLWNCTNSSYKQGKVIVMEILGINKCSVKLEWFWFPVTDKVFLCGTLIFIGIGSDRIDFGEWSL